MLSQVVAERGERAGPVAMPNQDLLRLKKQLQVCSPRGGAPPLQHQ